MGYLKRKLDRGGWLSQKRELSGRPLPEHLNDWLRATPEPPQGPGTLFVRLATLERGADSEEPLGVFQAVYSLRRKGRLSDQQKARASRALSWFGRNLKSPSDVPHRAIFWFRSDARRCLEKVWDLVRILRACGVEVRMQLSGAPGRLIYSDDLQVAAIPDNG